MAEMTKKERIMTTLFNKQADRIPVTPDISIMIPTKLTGRPSWDVEYYNSPSLSTAYINAAKHFGIDGWMFNGEMSFKREKAVDITERVLSKTPEGMEVQRIYHTSKGDLTERIYYPVNNPSTRTEKMIKDLEEDFPKVKEIYSKVISCDPTEYQNQLKLMGDDGMICLPVLPPGFQIFIDYFEGGLEAVTYAYYDYPEIFAEMVELMDADAIRRLDMALSNGVESILTGGSGSITLQSPALFDELSLPTIKKITKMCKEAGVLCGVHSCGKEMHLIEKCALETDLNYLNPLEIPPMGDCSLKECKQLYGDKLAIMGNLHTTDVMLYGSIKDVRRESLKAIRDAGEGGGFVLSTGDQCGRDTPEENIFEMVRVVEEFGHYPLDMDHIEDEIKKLENDK